jgi:outer membrane protein assembly factor BamB
MKPQQLFYTTATILLVLIVSVTLGLVPQQANAQTSSATYDESLSWPNLGHDASWTGYNPGPAPDQPNLLWTAPTGVTLYAGFNGKVYGLGNRQIYAFDPTTGQQLWASPTINPNSRAEIVQLDDNYLFSDYAGYTQVSWQCYNSNTGKLAWTQNFTRIYMQGAGSYFPGRYAPDLKLQFVCTSYLNPDGSTPSNYLMYIEAWSLANPANPPTLAWKIQADEPSEILCYGDGMLFMGSYGGYAVYALNATNGDLLWRQVKVGLPGYSAIYTDGILIQGSASTTLTAYNATNGDILWDKDQGGRAFFAYSGAAAYGLYFHANIEPPPYAFVGAWNITTGEMVWKADDFSTGTSVFWYNIAYIHPVVANGKVYLTTSDGNAVAGLAAVPTAFSCLDAMTGELLWTIPGSFESPFIAYGNLYAGRYCFGSEPQDWPTFRGPIDTPGVAQMGPANISYYTWMYHTDAALSGSPVISDSKVYFGSQDQNIYCLDANSGNFVWKFPIQYRVTSTPAVADGKVFTGPDDGNIYCIDANTGNQIWKKDLYSATLSNYAIFFESASWQPRSSPIIFNNNLYVGGMDGKMYCLSTADGSVKWSYQTGNAIGGSAAISNNIVYIASTDGNVYAFNAANGDKLWNWTTPRTQGLTINQRGYQDLFLIGSPVVAQGLLYIGAGAAFNTAPILTVALNASTGHLVWENNATGNIQPEWSPAYYNGVLYVGYDMGAGALNATTGKLIWKQWIGHEVFSSPSVATNFLSGSSMGPLVYIGCDTYSVTCLNALTGAPVSVYTTLGEVDGTPALWNGNLYVTSADGNLYCFKSQNIKQSTYLPFPGAAVSQSTSASMQTSTDTPTPTTLAPKASAQPATTTAVDLTVPYIAVGVVVLVAVFSGVVFALRRKK